MVCGLREMQVDEQSNNRQYVDDREDDECIVKEGGLRIAYGFDQPTVTT